jgi:hypothetical protein
MSDEQSRDIPPALNALQWRERRYTTSYGFCVETPARDELNLLMGGRLYASPREVATLAALIALANAAMNDEDPRKFARENLTVLRRVAEKLRSIRLLEDDADAESVDDLADVIESYLPPGRSASSS